MSRADPTTDGDDAAASAGADENSDGSPAVTDADVDVPAGADRATCAYCGEVFPTEEILTLHHGVDHYGALDDDERAAFEAAYDEENDELRSFQLRALLGLVLIYFGFLFVYAFMAL